MSLVLQQLNQPWVNAISKHKIVQHHLKDFTAIPPHIYKHNSFFLRERATNRSRSQEGILWQFYHQESINPYDTASGRLVTNPPHSYQQHTKIETSTMHLVLLAALLASAYSLQFKYHSHEEIEHILRDYQNDSRDFNATLYSIGKSVGG